MGKKVFCFSFKSEKEGEEEDCERESPETRSGALLETKKGESRVDVDAWAAERGPGVREHYKGNPSLGTLSRDSSDSDFFVILWHKM